METSGGGRGRKRQLDRSEVGRRPNRRPKPRPCSRRFWEWGRHCSAARTTRWNVRSTMSKPEFTKAYSFGRVPVSSPFYRHGPHNSSVQNDQRGQRSPRNTGSHSPGPTSSRNSLPLPSRTGSQVLQLVWQAAGLAMFYFFGGLICSVRAMTDLKPRSTACCPNRGSTQPSSTIRRNKKPRAEASQAKQRSAPHRWASAARWSRLPPNTARLFGTPCLLAPA